MENFDSIPLLTAALLAIVTLLASWKVFVKAGFPGWYAIIPLWNVYITLKMAGKPWWFLLLYFIPLVNLVIHIVVCIALAKKFQHGVGFGLGLVFLPFVFYPILGFGHGHYDAAA